MKCKSKFILAAWFSLLGFTASIEETKSFNSLMGNAVQGWAMTDDIGAGTVAGTVLHEGPLKHDKKDDHISKNVFNADELANMIKYLLD